MCETHSRTEHGRLRQNTSSCECASSAYSAFYVIGDSIGISYYIKKPGIPQHSIPEFRSVNHQSGSVMTYFFGSFPEMPSSAHWKASLYLPLDSLCSILRIFHDQSYDKAICGSV